MSKVWAFDLDGTLIEPHRFYGYAMLNFTRLMLDTFGWRSPRWLEVAQLADQIDHSLVPQWGGSRHRFPLAMTECYTQLCERASVAYEESVARRVFGIGESVFDPKNYTPGLLIPGVPRVLGELQSRGDICFIVTKGDPVVQTRKWRGCGLGQWFRRNHLIVVRWDPRAGYSGDKHDALRDLRAWFPSNDVLMVGDSVPDDIIPAIDVGIMGIHIPSCWRWNGGQGAPPLPEGAVRLDRIEEVLSVA